MSAEGVKGKPRVDAIRVAILIGGIHREAGQTNTILDTLDYLHRACPTWKLGVFAHEIDHLDTLPKYVDFVPVRAYYSNFLGNARLTRMLREYDVAYVKGLYQFVFPAVAARIPVALVVHQIDDWRTIGQGLAKIKFLLTRLIIPVVLRFPSAIVTVTEGLADFYLRNYGVHATVIGDTVSDDFFRRSRELSSPLNRPLRLLTVGPWDGWHGRKQQHQLFRLLAEGLARGLDLNLALVGLRPSQVRALQSVAALIKVETRVSFEGVIEKSLLVERYLTHDVYVTHTTFEGFYRPVIEAFATGMPALVYDANKVVSDPSAAAATNHIINSGGGELFTDADSFVEGLRSITANYDQYSARGFAYAQRFRRDALGAKTRDLLEDLVRKFRDGEGQVRRYDSNTAPDITRTP